MIYFLKKLKHIVRRIRWEIFLHKLGEKNKEKTRKEIFTHYFEENFWSNQETKSGDGSTLKYTERLRADLPQLLQNLNIHSILDAPCGDFHWFNEVSLPNGCSYIGADIVTSLILELEKKYKTENRTFKELDVIEDRLPEVELWFCRDLIFHLPNKDIIKIIENFLNSNIKYLLITSHGAKNIKNTEMFTGGFRPINLLNKPFSLPEPVSKIQDYVEGHLERYMFLYEKNSFTGWVPASKT